MTFIAPAPFSVRYKVKYMQRHVPMSRKVTAFDSKEILRRRDWKSSKSIISCYISLHIYISLFYIRMYLHCTANEACIYLCNVPSDFWLKVTMMLACMHPHIFCNCRKNIFSFEKKSSVISYIFQGLITHNISKNSDQYCYIYLKKVKTIPYMCSSR